MATSGGKIVVKIDGDIKGFQKAINDVKSGVDGVRKVARNTAVGFAAIGATIIGTGVKFNAEMEQYKAGFTTLLGSAEIAEKTLNDLKAFADTTPFELTELANASQTLLAYGETVEELMPDIKMLGDVSLGNKEKFSGLALAYAQVRAQGRLMGQDLNQMVNNGFNPLQIISEKTGESMASLKERMSDGEISFEMVAEAMKIATSEGGRFYKAMEAQSKTLTGQLSTLKDNIISFTGDVSSNISEKLTNDILPMLIDKVEELKQAWADGTLQDALGTAASLTAGFGAAVAGLNLVLFIKDIAALASGVKKYTTATKAAEAAQKALNAAQAATPAGRVAIVLASLAATVGVYAATHESAAEKIRESYEDAVKAIDRTAASEMAQAEVATQLKNRLFELEEQINSGKLSDEEAEKAKDKFNGVANQLNDIIPDIINNIYDENGAIDLQAGKVSELTDAYISLMKAKSLANAYQAKIDETNKALVEINEELKPYESGEKSKTVTLAARYGGKTYTTELDNKDYSDLIKQKDEYEQQIDGLFDSLEEELKKIPQSADDSGNKASNNFSGGISKGVSNATKAVKSGAKEQSEILKEQREKELRDLQYLRDMEKITDEQYYEALADYRDRYFEEGSEEWQNYNVEIYQYQKETQDKMLDEAEKAANELADTFTEKADALLSAKNALKDNLSELADGVSTITYKGFGEHGEDIVDTIISPDELKKANDLKEAFAESAQAARDRVFAALGDKNKELAQEIYNQIREMGAEEGLAFSNAINQANDAKFNEWIAEKKRGFGLDESTANELYQDEIDELEDFKQKIIERFGELPENFFGIGTDTAEQFGSGFMDKIREVIENARQQVIASMSNIASLPAVVSNWSGAGTVTYNSNSSTYYVQPAQGESTQAQLAVIRNAESVSKMRGGY